MNILAINTAQLKAGLALITDEKTDFNEFDSSVKYSESVMVGIDQILRKNDMPLSNLDAMAVVVGPGSFTGIRIGVSLLKGFEVVFPSFKKIEITSFEIINQEFLSSNKPKKDYVCVIDALSSKFYVQGFYFDNSKNFDPEVVEDLNEYKDFIKVGLKEENLEAMDFYVEPKVESLGEIATKKFKEKNFVLEVKPLYLRKSQAEDNLENKEAK